MKKGGFRSPKGMRKAEIKPPGMGKKPTSMGNTMLPDLGGTVGPKFKKGGMVSKKK